MYLLYGSSTHLHLNISPLWPLQAWRSHQLLLQSLRQTSAAGGRNLAGPAVWWRVGEQDQRQQRKRGAGTPARVDEEETFDITLSTLTPATSSSGLPFLHFPPSLPLSISLVWTEWLPLVTHWWRTFETSADTSTTFMTGNSLSACARLLASNFHSGKY